MQMFPVTIPTEVFPSTRLLWVEEWEFENRPGSNDRESSETSTTEVNGDRVEDGVGTGTSFRGRREEPRVRFIVT